MKNEESHPCNCGHTKEHHQGPKGLGGAQCRACPGDSERSWRHPYTPDPEWRGVVIQESGSSAREELQRYVVLLSDMWTTPQLVTQRTDYLYAKVRHEVLKEALQAIEDPKRRKAAGGGLGWETARDVVKNLIIEPGDHDHIWVTALDGNNEPDRNEKGESWTHCGICGIKKI